MISAAATIDPALPKNRARAPSLAADLVTPALDPENGSPHALAAASFSGWQNPIAPLDVNDDGNINSLDALIVINSLNSAGTRLLPAVRAPSTPPPPYLDTNGDGYVQPIDALLVINRLNSPVAVPEPSSYVLLLLGAAFSAGGIWRRRKLASKC